MAKQPPKRRTAKPIESLGEFSFQVDYMDEASAPAVTLPSQATPELEQHLLKEVKEAYRKVRGSSTKINPRIAIREWKKQVGQMQELVKLSASKMSPHLPLESVSFSLTFDAAAQVWFFAKVGAAATVQITFKRQPE